MMRRRAGDTEALDRQVVDADQLDGALHHPVSAIRSQIDEVGPKRTGGVPQARIAGAKQDATRAAWNARPT